MCQRPHPLAVEGLPFGVEVVVQLALFRDQGHAGNGLDPVLSGDMIGEIALAIEMGADAVDIGKTIHRARASAWSKVAHGSCTDLPPVRK